MMIITAEQIRDALGHKSLIEALENIFRANYEMPDRHHHYYPQPGGHENTLLIMPCWTKKYLGLKQVIVAPANASKGLPSINGIYTLADAATGQPLAVMDGASLTAIRTACASALAAKYLAPENAGTLLVIGGGKVAGQLVPAHLAVRNYKKVLLWMRRPDAFAPFRSKLMVPPHVRIEQVFNLEEAVREADVISSATLTETPIIKGGWLREGQHLDLIGSFRKNMREADDEAVVRSRLYVDSRHNAVHESGELGIPVKNGLITEADIIGDIAELCRGTKPGRTSPDEITLFKSVGIAIEDLAAASLVYNTLLPAGSFPLNTVQPG